MRKRGVGDLKVFLSITLMFIVLTSFSFAVSLFISKNQDQERDQGKAVAAETAEYIIHLQEEPSDASNQERKGMENALSVSLEQYPQAMLQNNQFQGHIVIGRHASKKIQEAAESIRDSLGIVFEKKRSEELEIHVETLGAASGEDPAMNENEMPWLLAPGKVSNNFGVYKYTQTLFLPEGSAELAVDKDEGRHLPREFFVVQNGARGYKYRATFLPALEGTHKLGKIDEIEDMVFTFLGKEYALVEAKHKERHNIKLLFVTNDIEDIMEEGEVKTYEIQGKTYTVQLLITTRDPKMAVFVINGVMTDEIKENDVEVVGDGELSIGVRHVYENEAGEVGSDMVRFFIGQHIIFEDEDTTNDNFISRIKTNKETLNAVKVNIATVLDEGTNEGDKIRISSMEMQYTPSRTLYIDGKMSEEVVEKEFEQAMILGAFEIEFAGAVMRGSDEKGAIEEYAFYPSSDTSYKLKFKNKGGQMYDREVLSCADAACSAISYGKDGNGRFRDLVVNESEDIDDGDWFFLSFNAYSHLMQFDGIDQTERTIHLSDIAETSEGIEAKKYEISYASNGLGKFELDDGQYTLNVSSNNLSMKVDMNGDGDFSDTSVVVRAKAGGDFTFSANNERLARIEYRTNELYEDTRRDTIFIPVFVNQDNELDINGSSVTGAWVSGFNMTGNPISLNGPLEIEDTGVEVGWTEFGMRGELTANEWDKQSTFTIVYPAQQHFGYVDVYGTNQPAVIKKDSDMKAKDGQFILIGNACTNMLISELMKKPDPCDSGLKEGEGVIGMMENVFRTGNKAIIISGATEQDMLNAAQVLIHYKDYGLKGAKVMVKKQLPFSAE